MNFLKLLVNHLAILLLCDAFTVQLIRKKKDQLSTNREKRSIAESQITKKLRLTQKVNDGRRALATLMSIVDTANQSMKTHKPIAPTTPTKIVKKKNKSHEGKRKGCKRKQKERRRKCKKGKKRRKKHRNPKKGKKRNRRGKKHRKNRKKQEKKQRRERESGVKYYLDSGGYSYQSRTILDGSRDP